MRTNLDAAEEAQGILHVRDPGLAVQHTFNLRAQDREEEQDWDDCLLTVLVIEALKDESPDFNREDYSAAGCLRRLLPSWPHRAPTILGEISRCPGRSGSKVLT